MLITRAYMGYMAVPQQKHVR